MGSVGHSALYGIGHSARARVRRRRDDDARRRRETTTRARRRRGHRREVMLELHRGRFVEWTPTPVTALACARGGALVACARDGGELEVYDTTRDWRMVARVPGHANAAISALTWVEAFEDDHGGGEDDDEDGEDDEDDEGANDARGGSRTRERRRGRGMTTTASNNNGLASYVLLSSSLDGRVRAWDLSSGRARSETDSRGGAVWAMEAAPTSRVKAGEAQRVAIACDDGCARIITMVGGTDVGAGLAHKRSFLRVQGRLLSLAWHPSEELLACGSSRGMAHVMDCMNFNELTRITIGYVPEKASEFLSSTDEHCVWSLLYLPDGVLVSGDSDGAVTFWDSKFSTELARYTQHKADVLALASTPSGNKVFASGVDSQVAEFEKLDEVLDKDEGYNKWAYTSSKRPHTHDVRALAMATSPNGDGILVSAGNDAQLLAYPAETFRKHHPIRVVSVPQRTPISTSNAGGPEPPVLLVEHARHLDVWRIGESRGRAEQAKEGLMKLAAAPAHMLRAELAGTRHILCSAISPDGKTIAVSDTMSMRLFEIGSSSEESSSNNSAMWSVRRQEPPAGVSAAQILTFAPDGKNLVAVAATGVVSVIDLDDWVVSNTLKSHLPKSSSAAKALAAATHSKSHISSVITVNDIGVPIVSHVQVSSDNQWLVVVTARGGNESDRMADGLSGTIGGGVHVYNFDTLKLHVSLPPPKNHASWPPISAVALSSNGVLALAGPNNALFTYDVDRVKPTKWSAALIEAGVDAPTALREMPGQICGLSFDPKPKMSVIMAYTPTAIARVDLSAKISAEATTTTKKKRRRERERGSAENYSSSDAPGGVRVLKLNDPCLYLGYADVDKALLVERPWADVLKSMSQPLYRHRFGT